MRKNISKNGLFGPRDRISQIKNKGYYQLVIVGLIILGLIIVGLFIYFVAIPMVAKDFQQEEGPKVIVDNQNDSIVIKQRENLYGLVNEHLFKIRYINHPQMLGNELICTGGIDPAGNPSLTHVYLYRFTDGSNAEIIDLNIKCENDNIYYPQLSSNHIAYVDAKADGGGKIFCYDRKSGKSKLIKEFYGAIPEIHLSQNRIIWFEQVTGDIASIYVYDVLLDKLATVHTQYGLPFVFGGVGVDGNKIIWAGLNDGDFTVEQLKTTGKNQLYILDLATGNTEKYYTDTYAYSPKISGNIIGWIDTNNSPTANLYIAVNSGEKKQVASDVSGYYIGNGYVVYCQNQRMYCYFVEKDLTLALSKEDKKTMMIGGKNGVVFWYDITQTYERDIVKYVKVDAGSWRE